jgi:hypothetical protein
MSSMKSTFVDHKSHGFRRYKPQEGVAHEVREATFSSPS